MGEPNDTLIMDTQDAREVAAAPTRGAIPNMPAEEPRWAKTNAVRTATAGSAGRFLAALLRALSAWPV